MQQGRRREACKARPAAHCISQVHSSFDVSTYAEAVGFIEAGLSKQLVELISGLDAVSLVAIIGTEDLWNVDMIPRLDIVVRRIPSVNVSLNGVALVTDDKAVYNTRVSKCFLNESSDLVKDLHNGVQFVAQHSAQLLHGQLQAAVSNKEDGTTIL